MATGAEDRYLVHIPSWRLDIEREIDLIEELARLHGYDKFPNTLPAYSGEVRDLPVAHKDARLRSTLLALGYNESISLTFISKDDAEYFSTAVPNSAWPTRSATKLRSCEPRSSPAC